MVTAGSTRVVGFLLSGGNVTDAQAGRLLLETLGKQETTINLLEDDTTGLTTWGLKFNL
jgi:ABC-type antimicrobial peptide transport system ATPase subunit